MGHESRGMLPSRCYALAASSWRTEISPRSAEIALPFPPYREISLEVSCQGWSYIVRNKMNFTFDVVMLVCALTALRVVFVVPLTPQYILDHRDVRNLVAMALAVAFVSEAFFAFVVPSDKLNALGFSIANVLFAAANYVDVVGFMPVVWRLYQAENALDDFAVGTMVSLEARQQAPALHRVYLSI